MDEENPVVEPCCDIGTEKGRDSYEYGALVPDTGPMESSDDDVVSPER